ncbi:MAG: aminodeoxychorismate/anthranilate synthase component II [Arachidicoccus sp.]|nr:aminodeoxychorismate/anthranilate synthase component II [Arachidicoccus sp.]
MSAKILIIDHNDSFTYNLVQLLEEANAESIAVAAFDNIAINEILNYDGIVLSPGPGLPKDYPASLELIKTFYKTKSILGVCLGMQMIVECFGSELYNLEYVQHGKQTEIYKEQDCILFDNISFPMKVGLYHSWAMNKDKKVDDLQITSLTDNGIAMSLKHTNCNTFGVQFHPESYMTEQGLQLMKNWLKMI